MTTLLLFLVLGGGGAYALSGHNSVRTDDIKNGEVRTPDLDDAAVTGQKVQDGSLDTADLDGLVASLGGDSDVPSGAPSTPIPYPLSDDTWVQPAGEVELLTGTVSYTTPASCLQFGNPEAFGNGTVRVKLPSGTVLSAFLAHLPANTQKTATLSTVPTLQGGGGPFFLFRQASDTTRTLTAEVEDNCAGGGDNFVVHSVDVDVIAVG